MICIKRKLTSALFITRRYKQQWTTNRCCITSQILHLPTFPVNANFIFGMSKTITVRVQSPEHGTKRLEVHLSDSIAEFMNKVQKEFGLKDIGWNIYKNRDKTGLIRTTRARKIDSQNLKHGDMLYLYTGDIAAQSDSEPMDASSTSTSTAASSSYNVVSMSAVVSSSYNVASMSANVVLDEIDQILEKEDGKIYRKKNEQLCRHGPQGKCLHCVPLEPYDEEFLKSCDPPIKFLSFHSYIRKLTGGVDKGKFVNLENLSCKIKSGCKEHPPWPGGICTKCQPTAVTLNRQKYRHVDYLNFENPAVADKFLDFWRHTGNQRIGILYGRYEQHKEIPLGIRAAVAAIYEPPQEDGKNKITLLPDSKEDAVNMVAQKLGLKAVGWIFTDLVADDLTKGTVKNFRGNVDSHFLSAEECIMAAEFQNKYPNPCKLSPEGHFGSKFVTVIVTGDSNNQIHFEGYQVSNQCMALVRDNCLIPTIDASELGYIKESTNEQYVPDVFYKFIDHYGNEVTQLARPLPVEYLLVDFPAAFPLESSYTYTFYSDSKLKPFPTEHREAVGEIQDFNALAQYLEQFQPNQFLKAMSDFHLLVFLATSDMLPLKEKIGMILDAVRTKNDDLAAEFKRSEEWATVEEMIAAHGPSTGAHQHGSYVGPRATALPPIGSGSSTWTCSHCTFINSSTHAACDICSLPRS